jgi:hypothetical protein
MFDFIKSFFRRDTAAQREWLMQVAVVINMHGPDSQEVLSFIDTAPNAEYRELAELSRWLKKTLSPKN